MTTEFKSNDTIPLKDATNMCTAHRTHDLSLKKNKSSKLRRAAGRLDFSSLLSMAPTSKLARSKKSQPTCTISMESVIVSNSIPSSSYDINVVPFPSCDDPEPIDITPGVPTLRRSTRSITTGGSCGTVRFSSEVKPRRRRSSASVRVTHHSLLSPSAHQMPIPRSSRLPADVRFAAMMRRSIILGVSLEDVEQLEIDNQYMDPADFDAKNTILVQNLALIDRLSKYLTEHGYREPPRRRQISTHPSSEQAIATETLTDSLPLQLSPRGVMHPSLTPSTSQLVAMLIMRHRDRSVLRPRSIRISSAEGDVQYRRPSPLARRH